ncbi:glyoxysomal processing protease, glyoxysomal isoform X2 [Punica granatum]|uniref:Glyoxysomal processing protease, glyoxysomal isoform X2 n=2 Tax=Punica granatum TaxID=22663 RepID=A0A6P8DQB6_PUNGR|nr:glyoxysomal processing protease, glyoxysomal isoform X2 [Punica granatum]
MGLPEIIQIARDFAVLVRVHGPDPKGLKMRKHAFHKYDSGLTTLSASGLLLPDALYDPKVAKRVFGDSQSNTALVVTVASVIESFLSPNHRGSVVQGHPQLIPGAQINILMDDNARVGNDSEESNVGDSCWMPATLLTLVDVPDSSLALQSLLDTSVGSSGHNWEIGWSLTSEEISPRSVSDLMRAEHQRHMTIEEWTNTSSASMGKSLTRIALLGVSLPLKSIAISSSIRSGDFVLAVGSPFGILSPKHFLNSTSVGSISNCYPPTSANKSLLMADIRCLPGMEGCPVFDENGNLIGILVTPLRQKTNGAQIQPLIPWEAITAAFSHILWKEPAGKVLKQRIETGKELNYIHKNPLYGSSSTIKKAMASVCLIMVGDSMWASGIVLNKQGLIITNAHLLEPWRFGRNAVSGEENGMEPPRLGPHLCDENCKFGLCSVSSSVRNYKKIRVRLDHREPWFWCNAKLVYICKGSLDIALLQLVDVPDDLSPIVVDVANPLQGSRACVIGHGLFGPRCEVAPSVSWGVVSKVVKTKLPKSYWSLRHGDEHGEFPVMLETTATVYAGASGGLVANSEGQMIGLITSNTRHGKGTVIPNLNFAIPCAALAPVFEFSQDMKDFLLLRDLDQPNKQLSAVWELMPQLSPEPGPTLPGGLPQTLLEDGKKEGRGSRFAKFISENDLLKRSTETGERGKLPRGPLSSKL